HRAAAQRAGRGHARHPRRRPRGHGARRRGLPGGRENRRRRLGRGQRRSRRDVADRGPERHVPVEARRPRRRLARRLEPGERAPGSRPWRRAHDPVAGRPDPRRHDLERAGRRPVRRHGPRASA
ncbi:MAG: hypothetical protein ACK55Z_37365, partial [bacterium]